MNQPPEENDPLPAPTPAQSTPPPLPVGTSSETESPLPPPLTSEDIASVRADLGEDEIVWPPPPPSDRWAHRRGEPRLFSLYWIAWLMLNSSLVLIRLGPRGVVDPAVSRPVTRGLFMMLALGGTLLWPMFRLSQAMPHKKPLSGLLLDVVIMYFTSQIVLWPQVLLAYWPTPVIMATSLSLLAWLLISASVLSIAMETERRFENFHPEKPIARRRAWWMVLCMALAAGGVIFPAFFGWTAQAQRPDPDLWMMASGITAPFELTRDRFWAGSSARISHGHWTAIWITLSAAGAGLLAALIWQILPAGKSHSGGITYGVSNGSGVSASGNQNQP